MCASRAAMHRGSHGGKAARNSTRDGVQLKAPFAIDEKVLCYEPDPTKAKVLYDAKVLNVRKDVKQKKAFEYLIHFQGWNASWDRYVPESFILKDNEENRDLQQHLSEEAQVMLQNSSKKKRQKISLPEVAKGSRSDGSIDGDALETCSLFSDLDDMSDDSQDEDDEGDSKETLPLIIPDDIKRKLEQDYELITQDERLVRIPASPPVAQVLEEYVKCFGLKELLQWKERLSNQQDVVPQPSQSIPSTSASPPLASSSSGKVPEKDKNAIASCKNAKSVAKVEEPKFDELQHIIKKINLVKEVADGLRLLFDFLHERILVYNQENHQLRRSKSCKPCSSAKIGYQLQQLHSKCCLEFEEPDPEPESVIENPPVKRATRKSKNSKARPVVKREPDDIEELPSSSSRGRQASSDASCNTINKSTKRRCPSPDSRRRTRDYISELMQWGILPDECYEMHPPNPSLIYGVVHLLRLFVKMPEILSKTSIPRKRLRILISHIHELLTFVSKYGESTDKKVLYYENPGDDAIYEKS